MLGEKIKNLRTVLMLTQEELANRCELTKSYISQLENDKTSPSLETLSHILEVLGSNLSDFFYEEKKAQIVFNEDEQYEADYEGYDITWLVPTSQKHIMEPIIMELLPDAITTPDMPHDGEEFGYVLEGKVIIVYGENEELINEKESFYIKTDKKHYIKNTKQHSKIIWVSCPPNF